MANRYAPWIEPVLSASGLTNVNAVAPVAIPGIALTITPHVATRIVVHWMADVTDILGAQGCLIRPTLNGSASPGNVIYKPLVAGARATVSGFARFDLVKETANAIALEARLDVAGGAFQIAATTTRMLISGMPRIHYA
ncbi:MAG TPA: hypothetical protein VJ725_07280 [Thermoanaerobaculia bacterium]|nr:hypothetical protein [Thermoanaerobaculia bacterium]